MSDYMNDLPSNTSLFKGMVEIAQDQDREGSVAPSPPGLRGLACALPDMGRGARLLRVVQSHTTLSDTHPLVPLLVSPTVPTPFPVVYRESLCCSLCIGLAV